MNSDDFMIEVRKNYDAVENTLWLELLKLSQDGKTESLGSIQICKYNDQMVEEIF